MLRAARKAAGLTQAEVARRMGTTQSCISRAESLKGPDPTVAWLERFAVATGKTLRPVISHIHRARRRPDAQQSLVEWRRMRRVARRAGCLWISVVSPGNRRELQMLVRMRWVGWRGDRELLGSLERAAERAFGRPARVIDLDTVATWDEAARLCRRRRNRVRAAA